MLKAIQRRLPNESLIYLGDTARIPYGTRSVTTVERYASEDAPFIESQNVKLIVVACNTLSAIAVGQLDRRCRRGGVSGDLGPSRIDTLVLGCTHYPSLSLWDWGHDGLQQVERAHI